MDYMIKAQIEFLKAHDKGEEGRKLWVDTDGDEVAIGDPFSFVVIPAACFLLDASKFYNAPNMLAPRKRQVGQAVEARLTDDRREVKPKYRGAKRTFARFEVEGVGDVWANARHLNLAPVYRWVLCGSLFMGLDKDDRLLCAHMRIAKEKEGAGV